MSGYNNFNEVNSNFEEQNVKQDVNKTFYYLINPI